MTEIWVLQHASCETLGTVEDALAAHGVTARYIRSFLGEPVPQGADAAGLIVLGGPMGVHEQARYPFLRAEMRLMENALGCGIPLLGICLGGQLLASVLGAPVTRAPQREIGWFPLTLTDAAGQDRLWAGVASPCPAFHWHGDQFDLPPGAVSLASSAGTACQVFRYGEGAYGFQCHLEVTWPMIEEWVTAFSHELADAGIEGRRLLAQSVGALPALHQEASRVFGNWARLLPLSA